MRSEIVQIQKRIDLPARNDIVKTAETMTEARVGIVMKRVAVVGIITEAAMNAREIEMLIEITDEAGKSPDTSSTR